MDKAGFWALIDASRAAAHGDPEAQLGTLRDQLAPLAAEEIVAFDRILSEYHARAYKLDLWGAAYVIGGGCSDDGFMDFRGWLISRGENAYEGALANPDSLADVVEEADGCCQVEGFQYVASQVWKKKTGQHSRDFPRHDIARSTEPAGTPWEEDDLKNLFPKLGRKFSWVMGS